MSGTMICETSWVDPPDCVVFKGREWPTYVPEHGVRKVEASLISIGNSDYGHYECSACGSTVFRRDLYCWHCGARFDEQT